jgi:hypothetical protein
LNILCTLPTYSVCHKMSSLIRLKSIYCLGCKHDDILHKLRVRSLRFEVSPFISLNSGSTTWRTGLIVAGFF